MLFWAWANDGAINASKSVAPSAGARDEEVIKEVLSIFGDNDARGFDAAADDAVGIDVADANDFAEPAVLLGLAAGDELGAANRDHDFDQVARPDQRRLVFL